MPHAWATNSTLPFPHVSQLRTREEKPIVMNLQRQSLEVAVLSMLGYDIASPWIERFEGKKQIKYDTMWLFFFSLILLSGLSADWNLWENVLRTSWKMAIYFQPRYFQNCLLKSKHILWWKFSLRSFNKFYLNLLKHFRAQSRAFFF